MKIGTRVLSFLLCILLIISLSATTSKVSAAAKKPGYLYIMLDAGHAKKYNRSPVLTSYYESNMNWQLQQYLKQELLQYKNVVVGVTRSNQNTDRNVYSRGQIAASYDLFLSIHSNAASSKTTDYPLIITQKGYTKDPLAKSLGLSIQTLMMTKQSYKTMQRLEKDGKTEYYGVLRGSKSVGTKGMILEHSFHTNLTATKWLSNQENLRTLAKKEAEDIANYYGLSKTASVAMPPSKTSISLSLSGYNALVIKWRKSINASGYQLYRGASASGKYALVKTASGSNILSYRNTGLISGKTYYYKVRPYRTVSGKTSYGAFTTIKAARVKPATPKITSKAGKKKVTIKWKKVTGASGYRVYRATKKNGKYKLVKTLKSKSRSYTNKKLKGKKRYYYKVRAFKTIKGKKVFSGYSNITNKKTKK